MRIPRREFRRLVQLMWITPPRRSVNPHQAAAVRAVQTAGSEEGGDGRRGESKLQQLAAADP